MAADDAHVLGATVLVQEPSGVALGCERRTALLAKLHPSFGRAEAKPRQCVDDRAQAVIPHEIVGPGRWLVAVENAQELASAVTGEDGFDFASEREDVGARPLRQHPCMHHQPAALRDRERTPCKPVDEIVAIRCAEDVVEGVAAVRSPVTRGDGEQMQIVIAEDRRRAFAHRGHLAQEGERRGPAVDEVADEPQAVALARKADEREEIAEFCVTALDIADCVERHEVAARHYNRGAL